nr:hypothetical protein [uncultured Pseudomonas sp.]
MKLNRASYSDLWDGEKSICFFVYLGQCFWVLDSKYNFCLDAEKDYKAYLEKGHITRDQYFSACKEFRGGVLRLSSENFMKYISGQEGIVFSRSEIESVFIAGVDLSDSLYQRIEKYHLVGAQLSASEFKAAKNIACLLPEFYINFDRKIYMHMDSCRSHEDLAYPDWVSICADFSHLIPDMERYWILKSKDYWKARFI